MSLITALSPSTPRALISPSEIAVVAAPVSHYPLAKHIQPLAGFETATSVFSLFTVFSYLTANRLLPVSIYSMPALSSILRTVMESPAITVLSSSSLSKHKLRGFRLHRSPDYRLSFYHLQPGLYFQLSFYLLYFVLVLARCKWLSKWPMFENDLPFAFLAEPLPQCFDSDSILQLSPSLCFYIIQGKDREVSQIIKIVGLGIDIEMIFYSSVQIITILNARFKSPFQSIYDRIPFAGC